MAATPSNRLRLTPSNSPFFPRPSRSPVRGRPSSDPSRLSLKRVIGTTCSSATGFDIVRSSFAYIAGGAVVVVDIQGDQYSQRFFRARPTAQPLYTVSPVPHAPSTPNSTPKANDSRNRTPGPRESQYGPIDWSESPTSSKTWTQRERIKAATCLSLSRDGRFLAVGETGYAPRVLIFKLQDNSSDIPLVSISEHTFGVNAVAWSPDGRYLASLGHANDGFLYIWKIDARTGAAKLLQQSRCTSYVRGMTWLGSSLVTFGVRHIKVWRVEEIQSTSPVKHKFTGDGSFPSPSAQKTLPGRNILLGSLLEATFTAAVALDRHKALVCSEHGDVCLLDDTNKQMKLIRVRNMGFPIHCASVRKGLAYVGGTFGNLASLRVDDLLCCKEDCLVDANQPRHGLLAMGFLTSHLVTVDANRSIDIWDAEHMPGGNTSHRVHMPIPGHSEPLMGVQSLPNANSRGAAFYTWSESGRVITWDMEGKIKSTLDVPIDQLASATELDPVNQLSIVRATENLKLFVAADKLGVLRVIDSDTNECLLDTKAHTYDCQYISIFENDDTLLMATCGRDRTAQLFHRLPNGSFEHVQTLEFAARVVQVLIPSADRIITCSLDRTLQIHDIITKEDEPEAIAAVPSRVITLKASPTSMVVASDGKSVFVSTLDRSVCQYELSSGRQLSSFKCTDESGAESVVLDSLVFGDTCTDEPTFLLGISNTDKSVRIYNAQTGGFLDREWGHTEAINGVTLVDDEDKGRKVVSVGSDGTIMIWGLDLGDPAAGSMSRDPSPAKEPSATSQRPPLRRVLSKAELADFQRPSPSPGRRSPPRTLPRRTSRFNLTSTTPTVRTPISALQGTPGSIIAEGTPIRRGSAGSPANSPPLPGPDSPKSRVVTRRPSLPALRTTPPAAPGARKKSSATNLRGSYTSGNATGTGFGSLSMATEQTCRQLRTYRKRLATSEGPIAPDLLAELDQELRLTAAALGDRAVRSKAMSDEINGLLDEKLERLIIMLDEKWRLPPDGGVASGKPGSASSSIRAKKRRDGDDSSSLEGGDRPPSAGESSASASTQSG